MRAFDLSSGVRRSGQFCANPVTVALMVFAAAMVPVGAPVLAGGTIATGEAHTCAVDPAGTLKCWGYNSDGQLGDATTAVRRFPVRVKTLTANVFFVAAGSFHTCATVSSGLRCWGNNFNGQVGDGTTIDRYSPAKVRTLTDGVMDVATGKKHSCALLFTGHVKCWGRNSGRLGNGGTVDSLTPVFVSGIGGPGNRALAIALGAGHSCALLETGAVKCWGVNTDGQLGNGTTNTALTPTDVTGLASGVQAIAAGTEHTCAVTDTGAVKCWGENLFGQLGDGTITDRRVPVGTSGLTSDVFRVSAGAFHTCALFSSGRVKCWGGNAFGQLGDKTTATRKAPVGVAGLTGGFDEIAAGWSHTCAWDFAEAMPRCWGANGDGQLGDGTTTERHAPVKVSGF